VTLEQKNLYTITKNQHVKYGGKCVTFLLAVIIRTEENALN